MEDEKFFCLLSLLLLFSPLNELDDKEAVERTQVKGGIHDEVISK